MNALGQLEWLIRTLWRWLVSNPNVFQTLTQVSCIPIYSFCGERPSDSLKLGFGRKEWFNRICDKINLDSRSISAKERNVLFVIQYSCEQLTCSEYFIALFFIQGPERTAMSHCYGKERVELGSQVFHGSMTTLPTFFLLFFNHPVAITLLSQPLICFLQKTK